MDESGQGGAKPKSRGIFFQCRVIKILKVRQDQCPYQNVLALYRLQRTSSSLAVCSLQRKNTDAESQNNCCTQTLLFMSKRRA